MVILGLQKVTLIDYPARVACVVFLHGCNFRCMFCHNPELVIQKPCFEEAISEEPFFDFLNKRKGKLDGVVITGGEPLLHSGVKEFAKKIKDLGFLVKMDTNGSFSKSLAGLLEENLLDYVAMDVKTGLDNYPKLTEYEDVEEIQRSIELIKKEAPEYEFRTTLVKGVHSEEDVRDILKLVEGAKKFVLQNFVFGHSISNDLSKANQFSRKELEAFAEISRNYVDKVSIRNAY